jgi:hypothetical protein
VPARESALESASASYGKAMGYAPLLDVLRGYFRIEARDEAGSCIFRPPLRPDCHDRVEAE